MKKYLIILTFLSPILCFSQDYFEKVSALKKEKIERSNRINSSKCKYYYTEYYNFNKKNEYKYNDFSVDELRSAIKYLEGLKNKYLQPNEAYDKYKEELQKLQKVNQKINDLQDERGTHHTDVNYTNHGFCDYQINEAHEYLIEGLNNLINNKLSNSSSNNNTNSTSNQSNNNSTSNSNNSSSQEIDSGNNPENGNSTESNTQDNSISESDRRTNEILERNGLNKTDAQRNEEITNIISDGIDDINDFIINSGHFSEENIAYRKKQREARKKRRKEKIENWYLEEYYAEMLLKYVYTEKKNMFLKSNTKIVKKTPLAAKGFMGGGIRKKSTNENLTIFGYKEKRKWLIRPKYSKAYNFYEGQAVVKENGDWKIIDIEGNELEVPSVLNIIKNSEYLKWKDGIIFKGLLKKLTKSQSSRRLCS